MVDMVVVVVEVVMVVGVVTIVVVVVVGVIVVVVVLMLIPAIGLIFLSPSIRGAVCVLWGMGKSRQGGGNKNKVREGGYRELISVSGAPPSVVMPACR